MSRTFRGDRNSRLRRAEQLIGGLGDERERWENSADRLSSDLNNLVGNVMLASGCLAYLGPFTSQFRKVSTLKGFPPTMMGLIVRSRTFTACKPGI